MVIWVFDSHAMTGALTASTDPGVRHATHILGIFALLTAATAMAGGTIELRLDGAPLANQQVTDYTDGSRYTTDASGRIEFPYSCPGMEYTDGSGVRYRMLEFCGVSTDLPVYKFDLTKTVTLSGRIEIDELCNRTCNLRFFNLDNGLSLNTGSGLTCNTLVHLL
jgi:hypothetical protein